MLTILLPIVLLGGVGVIFGIGLGFASKKLAVKVDPRVEKIASALPNANCGACGYPGCSGFAKAVAEGNADPTGCIPGGSQVAAQLAELMGLAVNTKDPVMAVVHCQGGSAEALDRSIYLGIEDCHAAVMTGNGSKVCQDGCLGLGTCVRVCPFNAITINENNVAVVIPDKCTGCGKCISACPRKLIELIPRLHKIYLACSNHERGAKVKKYCSVGCTACTLCVKATPSGAISMENNLPRLDYTRDENFIPAVNKCPSKCFIDLVKVRPKANIDTKCTGCGECVLVCPVKDAITGEIGSRYTVDKNRCIGCGICLDKCKAHAITVWGSLGITPEDKSKRLRAQMKG